MKIYNAKNAFNVDYAFHFCVLQRRSFTLQLITYRDEQDH